MPKWTIEDLRALDLKYAEQGMHMHQRPFRAAMEILGPEFVLGVGGNPEVEKITQAYAEMLPEAAASWPGMGIGIAASVDRVRKVTVAVVYGTRRFVPWEGLGFESAAAWQKWCRDDERIATESVFALADLFDLTYGLDDFKGSKPDAERFWKMAMANLENIAQILPTAFSVDAVIQSICMVAELSLKAALIANGAVEAEFIGKKGHDLGKLAERLATELPHRDDPLIQEVVAKLPPYVASRYSPAGLTRLNVVRLALGVQALAAATVRRFSDRDMAGGVAATAIRPPLFP